MELNDLNFTSGLRAKPLNENFNLIENAVKPTILIVGYKA